MVVIQGGNWEILCLNEWEARDDKKVITDFCNFLEEK